MQNSATSALFEEDGGQNIIRHESAYKIFAPKQLVTAGEEEEKQHKQHVYNHQPSSGVLAFSDLMGNSPTGFEEEEESGNTPELRS